MATDKRNRATLVYSHRDRAWGERLATALEDYRVPGRLIGREGRIGKVPAKLTPILRDKEEVPPSLVLGEQMREALVASEFLIVVCSPAAAQSQRINEEILTFKRMGRSDRILALTVAGEPNAADRGLPAKRECYPPALRFNANPDGTLSAERSEIAAIDVRRGRESFEEARLRLAAALAGVGYDALKRREDETARRRRQVWTVAAGIAGVALFALFVLTLFALSQAETSRNAALAAQSRFLAHAATEEAQRGDPRLAAQLALEALPRDFARPDRPFVPEAEMALQIALSSFHELGTFETSKDGTRLAAYLPDGRLATVDGAGRLAMWGADGAKLGEVEADTTEIDTLEASSDGQRLVTTSSASGMARLWDVDDLSKDGEFAFGPQQKLVAHFSADGRELAIVHASAGELIVASATDGHRLATIATGLSGVSDAAFLGDGTRIMAVGGTAGQTKIATWTVSTGLQSAIVQSRLRAVERIVMAANGTAMLISPWGDIDVVDGKTLALVANAVTPGRGKPVTAAAISPDGFTAVVAHGESNADYLFLQTGSAGNWMETKDPVTYVAFSPDGTKVVTGNLAGEIGIYPAGAALRSVTFSGHKGAVRAVRFDGDRIASAADDGTARLWALASPARARVVAQPANCNTRAAAASADGGSFAFACEGGAMVVVRADGTELRMPTSRGRLADVVLSADGALAADTAEDGTVRILQTGPRQVIRELDNVGPWTAATFWPQGGQLAVAPTEMNRLEVWPVAKGDPVIIEIGRMTVDSVAFGPDGTRLVVTGDSKLTVWNIADGKLVFTFGDEKSRRIVAAVPTPEGIVAVIANKDGTLTFWNAETGTILSTTPVLPGEAKLLHLAADAKTLALVLKNDLITLYDVRSGMPVARLEDDAGQVTWLAPLEGGSWASLGAMRPGVSVWSPPIRCGALLKRAASLNLPPLTEAERARFYLQDSVAVSGLYAWLRPWFAWALPDAGRGCE